ncbi:MAG TPA: hypothetical protein VFT74_05225, partial [Isosphaeraceae bacterium]|nr:hypothetical protein [Isosphaeraceae bacterium]
LFAPRRGAGEAIEEALETSGIDLSGRSILPETTPLTLRLLDADALAFRLPEGLGDQTRGRLSRESIEYYYEHIFPLTLRSGLGLEREEADFEEAPAALTVVEASRQVLKGNAVARAKLGAVVRLKEQLSRRPRVGLLYGGYPFDRLRRRLGLEPDHEGLSAPEDVTSMNAEELGRLDPASLDDSILLDAFRSARGLLARDQAARFLGALLERDPSGLRRDEAFVPFLVGLDDAQAARVLRRFEELAADQPFFALAKARFLAARGVLDEAISGYRAYLDQHPEDALAAFEAAEAFATDAPEQARSLAVEALERGRRVGDEVTAWNAERFLDRFDRIADDR